MRHRGENNTLGRIRILGIDPGNITCGYGIIETPCQKVDECIYITSGKIVNSKQRPIKETLKRLYDTLVEIIREYNPQEVAVEKIFFAKSIKAALSLGQARGIALLAASSEGLNVYEYSALEVKKAITGYGRAEKRQVQEMVMRILSPCFMLHAPCFVLTEDAADALALAICHMNTIKLREAIERGNV
ncbi:MAG: crossover junction endodeoxyribonuclease RuvC [Nitrospirota bacterium]